MINELIENYLNKENFTALLVSFVLLLILTIILAIAIGIYKKKYHYINAKYEAIVNEYNKYIEENTKITEERTIGYNKMIEKVNKVSRLYSKFVDNLSIKQFIFVTPENTIPTNVTCKPVYDNEGNFSHTEAFIRRKDKKTGRMVDIAVDIRLNN